MNREIEIQPNHTVTSWRVGEVDILYPERQICNEKRGGMPMCAPMFSVQQRPVEGCNLPPHGILMYDQTGVIEENGSTMTVTTHYKADAKFAWDFVATTNITIDRNVLTHFHTVELAVGCLNPVEMPLSLGLHPYFATHGEDFSYIINDIQTKKENIPKSIIDSDFAPIRQGESAQLITASGTITITPEGYDEYCLWTDDKEKYICIEPIFQYREFGLPNTGLAPGETKRVSTEFRFNPLDD